MENVGVRKCSAVPMMLSKIESWSNLDPGLRPIPITPSKGAAYSKGYESFPLIEIYKLHKNWTDSAASADCNGRKK